MNGQHQQQGMGIGWIILLVDPLHHLQPYSRPH